MQGPLCPLDSNLSHFILVESGTLGSGNDRLAELQLSLEKHISQQRTGYGGKAHSSCPEQHLGDGRHGDVAHTSKNFMERVGKGLPGSGGGFLRA